MDGLLSVKAQQLSGIAVRWRQVPRAVVGVAEVARVTEAAVRAIRAATIPFAVDNLSAGHANARELVALGPGDVKLDCLREQGCLGAVSLLSLHRVMPMNAPRSHAARVFRVLGDDTRLAILALLRVRELCVCEMTALVGLSQAAVSEHLRRLKDAGLVEDQRRGTWAFYRLRSDLPDYVRAALESVELPAEDVLRFAEMVPGARCSTVPEPALTSSAETKE